MIQTNIAIPHCPVRPIFSTELAIKAPKKFQRAAEFLNVVKEVRARAGLRIIIASYLQELEESFRQTFL
jgi:hypothetical protein